MKCLSLKQPYAELIVSGRKTIELRKWNTHFRGKFLVHASKGVDKKACVRFGFSPEKLSSGAIVGSATIYGVKEYGSKKEFLRDKDKHLADYASFSSSKYGFLLKGIKRLRRPIAFKGMLNFFEVNIRAPK